MIVSLPAIEDPRYVVVWRIVVPGLIIVIVLAWVIAQESQPHVEAIVASPSLSGPSIPVASAARLLPA